MRLRCRYERARPLLIGLPSLEQGLGWVIVLCGCVELCVCDSCRCLHLSFAIFVVLLGRWIWRMKDVARALFID